jgi:hypothetical protein
MSWRTTKVAALLVSAAGLVLINMFVSGKIIAQDQDQDQDQHRSSPTAGSASSRSSAAQVTLAAERASIQATVRGFVQQSVQLLHDGASLRGHATPEFAADIAAARAQARSNRLVVLGKPTVADLDIVSLSRSEGTPTALVATCVDGSDVRIRDRSGRVVQRQPGANRSLYHFTLVRPESKWLMAARNFPADPSC